MAARPFVLPYEPDYAGHRDAARRRAEVAETLKRREETQTPGSLSASLNTPSAQQPSGHSSR